MNWPASITFGLSIVVLCLSASFAQDSPQSPAIYPLDSIVSSDGDIFTVDRKLPGVWKFSGGNLTAWHIGEKQFRQPMNAPRSLVLDIEGRLFVSDTASREIFRFDEAIGQETSSNTKPIATIDGKIGIPMDMAVDSAGNIFVADLERRIVWKCSPDNEPVEFASENARGLCVDSEDNLWLLSQDEEQLVKLTQSGQRTAIVSERTFDFANCIVVDSDGVAWVTDGYKKALWRIAPGQSPQIVFEGEPLIGPVGITLRLQRPLITDPRAQKVFEFTVDGEMKTIIDFVTMDESNSNQ